MSEFKCHFDRKGRFHRIGSPAIEGADGTKSWYINGQYHRLEGPAVEYACGTKLWSIKIASSNNFMMMDNIDDLLYYFFDICNWHNE